VEMITLDPAALDSTVWRWELSGIYSTSLAYQALFLGQHAMEGAKELWKVRAPNKCRMFIWLLLQDRIWNVLNPVTISS
jgi:hypothetical protein